jgi:hypothetical protein
VALALGLISILLVTLDLAAHVLGADDVLKVPFILTLTVPKPRS